MVGSLVLEAGTVHLGCSKVDHHGEGDDHLGLADVKVGDHQLLQGEGLHEEVGLREDHWNVGVDEGNVGIL